MNMAKRVDYPNPSLINFAVNEWFTQYQIPYCW